jgi:hypothetical protein
MTVLPNVFKKKLKKLLNRYKIKFFTSKMKEKSPSPRKFIIFTGKKHNCFDKIYSLVLKKEI